MTASGEVMRELPAHAELERWYRRLLWAYPIGYRRVHGEEILATLMDSAQPGRRRPARADVADLARGAVRQWFRLPVGLSAMVAAVLAAMVLGAVGAAAASWLARQTNELPSDAAAVHIAETVVGTPVTDSHVDRHDGGRRNFQRDVQVGRGERALPNWTIETAQARLRADGWTLGRVEKSDGSGSYQVNERLDAVIYRFQATRDGYVITADAQTILTPAIAGTYVDVTVELPAPSWEPVAIGLGRLVGAITGWLLTGWTTYRLRRQALPRRLTALLLGFTTLGLAAHPTIGLYNTLATLESTEFGFSHTTPAHYWVVARPAAELVGATLATGLAILVLAATARRPTARPTVAAA